MLRYPVLMEEYLGNEVWSQRADLGLAMGINMIDVYSSNRSIDGDTLPTGKSGEIGVLNRCLHPIPRDYRRLESVNPTLLYDRS